MFWKKKEKILAGRGYDARYAACVRAKTPEAAAAILKEALADAAMSELDYAVLCHAIYEGRREFYFHQVVYLLSDRYSHSLYPIQAFAALFLASDGDFDGAGIEARLYLKRMRDSGLLYAYRPAFVDVGLAEAFLLLANAYTALGARSYARRVLMLGLSAEVKLEGHYAAALAREEERLAHELTRPALAGIDGKWELFFRTGYQGIEDVAEHCRVKGAEHSLRRIRLIESHVRFGQRAVLEFSHEVFLALASSPSRSGEAPVLALA